MYSCFPYLILDASSACFSLLLMSGSLSSPDLILLSPGVALTPSLQSVTGSFLNIMSMTSRIVPINRQASPATVTVHSNPHVSSKAPAINGPTK